MVQFGGMDQAHEDVADTGPIQGAVEERVFPVQDRLFENSFAKVMPTPGLCRVPLHKGPLHAF